MKRHHFFPCNGDYRMLNATINIQEIPKFCKKKLRICKKMFILVFCICGPLQLGITIIIIIEHVFFFDFAPLKRYGFFSVYEMQRMIHKVIYY